MATGETLAAAWGIFEGKPIQTRSKGTWRPRSKKSQQPKAVVAMSNGAGSAFHLLTNGLPSAPEECGGDQPRERRSEQRPTHALAFTEPE